MYDCVDYPHFFSVFLSCQGNPLPENCVPFMEMTERAALYLVQTVHTTLIEFPLVDCLKEDVKQMVMRIFASIEKVLDAISENEDDPIIANYTGTVYYSIESLEKFSFNNQVLLFSFFILSGILRHEN